MTYRLIQHIELTGTQASIEFSSIPQTFTDLVIVCSLRGSAASAYNDSFIQFNGDTGANYSVRSLASGGNPPTSNTINNSSNGGRIGFSVGGNATANTFGSMKVHIPEYRRNSTKAFTSDAVTENVGGAYMTFNAMRWTGTAPISSLAINGLTTNFVQFSSVTLYGITRGATLGVTVS